MSGYAQCHGTGYTLMARLQDLGGGLARQSTGSQLCICAVVMRAAPTCHRRKAGDTSEGTRGPATSQLGPKGVDPLPTPGTAPSKHDDPM